MELDSLLADVKPGGDLLVRQAIGYRKCDATLCRRQQCITRGCC